MINQYKPIKINYIDSIFHNKKGWFGIRFSYLLTDINWIKPTLPIKIDYIDSIFNNKKGWFDFRFSYLLTDVN